MISMSLSFPGARLAFINTGTVFAPNFVPQMYSRDSLEEEIDSVYTDNGWHTDLGIPGAGFNCNVRNTGITGSTCPLYSPSRMEQNMFSAELFVRLPWPKLAVTSRLHASRGHE